MATFSEEVDFILPGSLSVANALVQLTGRIKAVEIVGSDRNIQVGTAADWRINPVNSALAGTIYTESVLDLESAPTLVVPIADGNMTVDGYEKTLLLPLLF